MKVLMINSVCGIGSTGRICVEIAELLAKNGDECKIVYGRKISPKPFEKYAIKISNALDVRVNAIKARLFDNDGFNAKHTTKKLLKIIEEIKPDVVHLHNLHGYYINVEILFNYIKKSNIPTVWTLHDCWAFTGHCAYFDMIGCEKWKTGCFNCSGHLDYPRSFKDCSMKQYKRKKGCFTGIKNMTIVTPSNWLKSKAKQSFLADYPIKVINNGINLTIFKPTESNLRQEFELENKKVLLFVADVWSERKGFSDVIKLSNQLSEEYQIVIIGLSEEQKASMPDNIIGLKRTENVEELVKWYSVADLFVNTTKEENFPTVNIESLACGTPVITYKTGGSPEILDCKCGIVVEKNNVEQLVNTIKDYFAKDKFSQEDCLNRAKIFNKNDRFKDYLDLYEEILKA